MKLNLKYPVGPYIVFQKFGADEACYRASDKSVVTKQDGVCPLGYTSLYAASGMKGHSGIDMFGPHDMPIYYSGPEGIVEEIQSESARGLGLGIITKDMFEFEGGWYQAKTRYWHLKDFNVEYDQVIKTGDLIGWADNTGYSSGDHLHFELKPVVKNSKGSYYNAFQENGFYGAVDPSPCFDGTYAHVEKFIFTKNLEIGMKDPDVKRLQQELLNLGYFTYFKTKEECTDFYGRETAKAVLKFQWEKQLINIWQYFYYGGRFFYEKTRSKLNEIISNN